MTLTLVADAKAYGELHFEREGDSLTWARTPSSRLELAPAPKDVPYHW